MSTPANYPPIVAILEDDPGMQMLLNRILAKDFTPRIYRSGRDLLYAMRTQSFELALLDLSLSGEDGLDILREIRLEYPLPVIIVSAQGHPDIIAAGLNIGADDYVTKPFVPSVLSARIRSVMRRYHAREREYSLPQEPRTPHVLKHLYLPEQRTLVSGTGQRHLLTERESHVLRILCEKSPGIATRDEIMRRVSGTDWDPTVRSLDVHICRIRAKLASASSNGIVIDAIRGVGYRLRRNPIAAGGEPGGNAQPAALPEPEHAAG